MFLQISLSTLIVEFKQAFPKQHNLSLQKGKSPCRSTLNTHQIINYV